MTLSSGKARKYLKYFRCAENILDVLECLSRVYIYVRMNICMLYQLISNYVSMGTAREALARARARTRMHAHARACTHQYIYVRMHICMIRQVISNYVSLGTVREALAQARAGMRTHAHAHTSIYIYGCTHVYA